jgi:hypothetical protein
MACAGMEYIVMYVPLALVHTNKRYFTITSQQ